MKWLWDYGNQHFVPKKPPPGQSSLIPFHPAPTNTILGLPKPHSEQQRVEPDAILRRPKPRSEQQRVEPDAILRRPKLRSQQRRVKEPLLHQVLHKSFKAQRESKLKIKDITAIPEEADVQIRESKLKTKDMTAIPEEIDV